MGTFFVIKDNHCIEMSGSFRMEDTLYLLSTPIWSFCRQIIKEVLGRTTTDTEISGIVFNMSINYVYVESNNSQSSYSVDKI